MSELRDDFFRSLDKLREKGKGNLADAFIKLHGSSDKSEEWYRVKIEAINKSIQSASEYEHMTIPNRKFLGSINDRIAGESYTPALVAKNTKKMDERLSKYQEMSIKNPLAPTLKKIGTLREYADKLKTLAPATALPAALPSVLPPDLPPVNEETPAALPPVNTTPYVEETHACPPGSNDTFVLGGDESKDGNCFYSSLYKAALHHSDKTLVNRVSEIFTGKILNHDSFIIEARKTVGDKVRKGIYKEIKEKQLRDINRRPDIETEEGRESQRRQTNTLFESLWYSSIGDSLFYDNWLQESPKQVKEFFSGKQFESIYPEANDKYEMQFYSDMANYIEKSRIYSSQTDIDVVKYILMNEGIILEIISDETRNKCSYLNGKPALWLFKIPDVEHYEYFSFQVNNLEAEPSVISGKTSNIHEKETGINESIEEPLIKSEIQSTEVKQPCTTLYDPCTGTPIEPNTMKELEKRIRNLRTSLSDNPETEKFPSVIATRLDLLIDLLNRKEPPNSNLFKYTINGQLYEAYWDIVFALNLLDDFQRTNDFFMINKKAESIHASEAEIYNNNPIEYLRGRNVNEGASGASDITFCYKNPKEVLAEDSCSAPSLSAEACSIGAKVPVDTRTKFYFCSSKFYRKDASKSAESFDIQKIYTAVKKLHNDYDVRIVLLVKDKEAVDTKLKNARNKYISEEASSVYGEKDLFAALLKLYDLARQKIQGVVTEESLKSVLGITDTIKPILSPRLHQHMAILKIKKAIETFKKLGGNNKFLVGILPRGGKTYIAGGLVSILQPKRVVVLLGAKSETISQFTNDLFRYYQDFSDYQVVDVLEGHAETAIDPLKKYIFVMSVELYKTESSTRRILIDLKSGANRADLFICDEAHLKQTTDKAIKELDEGTLAKTTDKEEESQLGELDKEISKDIPVVYMTGTYIKPLTVFKIPEDNVAIWDYQDIQEGKNIIDNEQYFKETFPGIYEEALAKCFAYGESYESIQNMYRRFPNLYLLSTQFTDDAKESFLKQSQEGETVGFPTITHLFQVKKDFSPGTTSPDLWHTGFTNPSAMARLINYLSPRSDIKTIEEGKEITQISSVMTRIDRISQRIGDRLAFFTKDFVVHTQLWFLPYMQRHPLINRMCALAGIIFQSPWYRKHFNVLAVTRTELSNISNSKESTIKIGENTFSWACSKETKSLKACILREEAKSRAQGKGLVILAQNMLHLGISLTCVDIVVLLDAGEKVDERIQKMYRALTESTNKKGGFIVDMNYFRTVTAIMNYQIQASKSRKKKEVYADSGLKEAFNSIIETYSIDDDLDIYSSKEEGSETRIEKETIPELQRMLQKAPAGRGDGMVISEAGAALNRNIESVLKDEYARGLDHILGELADDPEKKILRQDGSDIDAAEEEREDSDEKAPRAPKLFPNAVEQNPEEKRKAFMDIFKTTLKLGIFGTEYKTISELIEGFRTDESLREIVYDTLVKRGAIQAGADPEDLNRLILRELALLAEKKQDSYKGMKEAFNSRDSRKETFQEILKYIVDNLAPKDKERHLLGEVFTPLTLVDEMLSKLPAEVWTNKDLKWLDPANGIGNFPIKAFIGQAEGEFKYAGLFEGLKKAIPDDTKRCKWIIEEMLYMVDINGKNNLIARRLFEKLCPGAKSNIEKIDSKNGFLTDKPLVFNGKELKTFDIIMGNPPYNRGGINRPDTRKNKKLAAYVGEKKQKKETIWNKFVLQSYKYLNKEGFLLFIHPVGWFHSGDYDNVREILLQKEISYIRIYHKSQSKKVFGGKGEITVAYYCLQNKPSTASTRITGMDGKVEIVKLHPNSIILLNNTSIINKCIEKSSFWKDNKNFKHTTTLCNEGSYKQIKGIYHDGYIRFVKTSKKHDDQDIPKIIISGATYPRIYYDKKGEYGVTGSGPNYWIGSEKELKLLDSFLKTKLAAFLTKELRFRYGFSEFKYFPDITKIDIGKITDESLADYFSFTKEEREVINTSDYPNREYIFKEITCSEAKDEKAEVADEPAEGGSKQRRVTRKLRR